MTDHEYVLKRLMALETALRSVMATVMEMMPPAYANAIDRIGQRWDGELDALVAQRDSTDQAKG